MQGNSKVPTGRDFGGGLSRVSGPNLISSPFLVRKGERGMVASDIKQSHPSGLDTYYRHTYV